MDTKEHNLTNMLGSNSFYSRKNQGGSRDQINIDTISLQSNTIKTLKLSNKYDSFKFSMHASTIIPVLFSSITLFLGMKFFST